MLTTALSLRILHRPTPIPMRLATLAITASMSTIPDRRITTVTNPEMHAMSALISTEMALVMRDSRPTLAKLIIVVSDITRTRLIPTMTGSVMHATISVGMQMLMEMSMSWMLYIFRHTSSRVVILQFHTKPVMSTARGQSISRMQFTSLTSCLLAGICRAIRMEMKFRTVKNVNF